MKITFLINKLLTGGSELKTINIANYLSSLGHDVKIICCKKGSDQYLIDKLDSAISFADCDGVHSLLGALRKESDVFFLLNNYPSYFSVYIRMFNPKSAIYFLNNSFYDPKELGFVKFNLIKFSSYFLTKIVFGAAAQQDLWLSSLNVSLKKSTVIYNGVDTEKYIPDIYEQEDCNNLLKLIMVGQLRPEKNHLEAFAALSILKQKNIEFRLTIVGSDLTGQYEKKLKENVLSLGLQDDVCFYGKTSNVKDILLQHDVFLLTSSSVETFSNAALEAMACGLVPVLSDIGGASEMVSSEIDGVVYPSGKALELADKLALLTDPVFRTKLSSNARDKVCSRFSLESMYTSYTNLLV